MVKRRLGKTMKIRKAVTPEHAEYETVVFWDINRCPLPAGSDPCRVGRRIDSALMKLGYTGPLTITAIGDLDDIPIQLLRVLSSSGIGFKHVGQGKVRTE